MKPIRTTVHKYFMFSYKYECSLLHVYPPTETLSTIFSNHVYILAVYIFFKFNIMFVYNSKLD